MEKAKFILDKKIVKEQIKSLLDLGLSVSYSYKTNHEVGNVLQELNLGNFFSIHSINEIKMIKDKSKVIYFIQAQDFEELKGIINQGILNFVVDNEIDFGRILDVAKFLETKINLSIRMKLQENRIGSGRYFVYGLPSKKVNELIIREKENKFINYFGIHVHRKSQNTSEWEIISELEDSILDEVFDRLDFINLGGGLPVKYKSYSSNILEYIFKKIKETVNWLKNKDIQVFIEPGRYIAAPSIKLETRIIQIQEKNIILNTTLYNCALDTLLTGTKMIVENELKDKEEGEYYLIKGNSPTRDDIFRYNVKLRNPKVGDKIIFINAGAYNYTTDFFGYVKLETEYI
ncbi:MAG: decarboxylase [Candidatus Pacearchaeota archaeon]